MDKKESKRKGDDQSREPGRHPQAPEPERRYPDSNRPDTLRPDPGEQESPGERKSREGARQSDESRVISAEYGDEDDEDIDDADIDDEVRPARPV